MHRQQEGEPSGSALPAAEKELWVTPFTYGKVQGAAYFAPEISVNLRPIYVRSKTLVQFLEKRHHRFELFYEYLIRKTSGGSVDLPCGFEGVFSNGNGR